jgi:hypothetical protein
LPSLWLIALAENLHIDFPCYLRLRSSQQFPFCSLPFCSLPLALCI